jgi:hypothetical protein
MGLLEKSVLNCGLVLQVMRVLLFRIAGRIA